MGMLVNGVWHDVWYDTKSTGGQFVRSASQFRNYVTADGAPGPTGTGGLQRQAAAITSMSPMPVPGRTGP